jgi:hypothetical protein
VYALSKGFYRVMAHYFPDVKETPTYLTYEEEPATSTNVSSHEKELEKMRFQQEYEDDIGKPNFLNSCFTFY